MIWNNLKKKKHELMSPRLIKSIIIIWRNSLKKSNRKNLFFYFFKYNIINWNINIQINLKNKKKSGERGVIKKN